MPPTIVDSTQCHLWTDALHARQLARDALNKWDRGTYVRMCVVTAWIALETSCQNALNAPRIGYSFRKHLDKAVAESGLAPLDWTTGVWREVSQLQHKRKMYIHQYLSLSDMYPEASVAEQAINIVRSATSAIFRHVAKLPPPWISLDHSAGWQPRAASTSVACITVYRFGAQQNDHNTVKVFIVVEGEEHCTTVLPHGYDASPVIAELLQSVRIPISAIRVYESGKLTGELLVNMRGNA